MEIQDVMSPQVKPTPFQEKVITAIFPEYQLLKTISGFAFTIPTKNKKKISSFSLVTTTKLLIGKNVAAEINTFKRRVEFRRDITTLVDLNEKILSLGLSNEQDNKQVVLRKKQKEQTKLIKKIKKQLGISL